jgi:hypothetical protein
MIDRRLHAHEIVIEKVRAAITRASRAPSSRRGSRSGVHSSKDVAHQQVVRAPVVGLLGLQRRHELQVWFLAESRRAGAPRRWGLTRRANQLLAGRLPFGSVPLREEGLRAEPIGELVLGIRAGRLAEDLDERHGGDQRTGRGDVEDQDQRHVGDVQ